MSTGAVRDCNLQSGAVLWLRHSFARAFSGDSVLFPLPCGGGRGWVVMLSASETFLFVIASEHNVRARQSTVCEARIMGILCSLIASLRSQ